MIIDLNESRIRTLDQVRAVLDGTRTLDFTPAENRYAQYTWIAFVLARLAQGSRAGSELPAALQRLLALHK